MNEIRSIFNLIVILLVVGFIVQERNDKNDIIKQLEISKTENSKLNLVVDHLQCDLEREQSKVVFVPLSSEILLMARVITSEATGEPLEGRMAVGEVVLNRLGRGLSSKAKKRHGNTLAKVIHRPGQFDGVRTKYFHREPTQEAILAAILSYYSDILPNASYHFANEVIATDRRFVRKMSPHTFRKIGRHTFYNYKS